MAPRFRVPRTVERFGRVFEEAGYSCYLVGGAVRNMVLRHRPTDFDFATDATPQQVMRIFARVIPTGIKHGTVTVLFEDQSYEVTTFRVEGTYSDSRHPDEVSFTTSIEDDLSRRDFTINAMALRVPGGRLQDPFGGRRDITRRLIRTVGPADERLSEDALRMIRGCRFSAQLEFELDGQLHEAMKRAAPQIVRVSAERVREELEKTMAARTPSLAFFEMEAAGLMDRILPELSACRGVPQGDFHSYDVLDHSLYACDGAPAGEIEIRFAALLHDIGKASTYEAESGSGRPTFYGHEEESERMALDICRRLKFSRASEQKILRLIRHHMFHYTPDWSDAAVRRFIARVGDDLLEDLFTLRRADTYGMVHRYRRDRGLEELYARIQRVLRERQALSVRDLAVDGHILESEAGIPKGPDMGTVIDHLMEAVLDDPSMNTKEKLLELARSFYATYLRDEDSGS